MNTILSAVVLLVLLLGTAAAAGYFLVLVPRRWRLPYERAVAFLPSHDPDDLELAEKLLGDAINAGPRGADLSRIRLARVCVRAKQGTYDPHRHAAAATALEELIAADGRTGQTAFLELWLQARMEAHERVVELFAEHEKLLAARPDSRRIAAVSHLRLASAHWRRREAEGALRNFDRVKELGELTDEIPHGVDDLQLVRGVQAVFDGQLDDARDYFAAARTRAVEQGRHAYEAEVGLIVCAWERDDPKELGDRLGRIADQLDRLPVDDTSADELATGIAVLRLISLLREWLRKPALSGAPTPEEFAELERRAEDVRVADRELGAANLIEGLVRYYFALSQPERERALEILERGEAVAKSVWPPEVVELVTRERKLGEGDPISQYLSLLTEFLDDPGRPEEDRARLRALKERFARFAEPIEPDEAQPQPRSPEDDPRQRAEALRQRVELIVYPRIRDLPEDAPARELLRELLAALDKAAGVAAEGAGVLHEAQLRLFTTTAQTLLPEEIR
ncbi:MAG TPA: hypothetical protein VFN97_04840 [Actinospica sp.]|nr:hypothetical protein [Actinospica sp.]